MSRNEAGTVGHNSRRQKKSPLKAGSRHLQIAHICATTASPKAEQETSVACAVYRHPGGSEPPTEVELLALDPGLGSATLPVARAMLAYLVMFAARRHRPESLLVDLALAPPQAESLLTSEMMPSMMLMAWGERVCCW